MIDCVRIRRWVVAGVIAAAACAATLSLGGGQRPLFGQVRGPVWPDPIYIPEDAVDRSAQLFPITRTITAAEARLVTYQTYAVWSGRWGDNAFDPGMPVWAVGLRADNLRVKDVLLTMGFPWVDARPCVGALYVWDATTGDPVGQGPIMDEGKWQGLIALQPAPLVILTATMPPALPTADPTYFQ